MWVNRSMQCRKTISYLNAYVDGELAERRCRNVEIHLADCESCRDRLEEIRGLTELFEGSLPVPPVPDRVVAKIMAEARRRQPVGTHGSHLSWSTWNPSRWVAGLSVPMRFAAFCAVLLAIVVGLSLDRGSGTRQNALIEQGEGLYGLEWFAPAPPVSIGSIYLAMTDRPSGKGDGK